MPTIVNHLVTLVEGGLDSDNYSDSGADPLIETPKKDSP
jgi:hypothetical protein